MLTHLFEDPFGNAPGRIGMGVCVPINGKLKRDELQLSLSFGIIQFSFLYAKCSYTQCTFPPHAMCARSTQFQWLVFLLFPPHIVRDNPNGVRRRHTAAERARARESVGHDITLKQIVVRKWLCGLSSEMIVVFRAQSDGQ